MERMVGELNIYIRERQCTHIRTMMPDLQCSLETKLLNKIF